MDNNNPNQNQNQNSYNAQQLWAQHLKKKFKTSTGLKYAVALLVGLLPMLMFGFMFNTNSGDSEPWVNIVNYGTTWGIAIGMYAFSIIVGYYLVKYVEDIKVDTISTISQMAMIILIFYVTPEFEIWAQFLLAIPVAIITQVFTSIIVFVVIFTKQAKSLNQGMQDFNGMFKKPSPEEMEKIMSKLDESLAKQGINVEELREDANASDTNYEPSKKPFNSRKKKRNSKSFSSRKNTANKNNETTQSDSKINDENLREIDAEIEIIKKDDDKKSK